MAADKRSEMKPSKSLWRGLPLQLFLIAILPLTVLVLAVTFGSLELHHQGMRALVGDRNLRSVRAAADSIEREITRRGALLQLVSRQLDSGAPEYALDGFEPDLGVFDGGVALQAPGGEVIASIGGETVRDWLMSRADGAGRQDPDGTGVDYLPDVVIQNANFVAVRVSHSSGVVLWGLFSTGGLLADALDPLSESGKMTVIVANADGQLLYRRGSLALNEDWQSQHGIHEALQGQNGINTSHAQDGEHVIASGPIGLVGWALMIEESWEDIASPLLQATQVAPLIAVPILVLSLLALWFGLRQIVQPLRALETAAGDLARGNFETIRKPVGGVPEVRQLQENLVAMAEQLQDAQNSLHGYIGAITDSVEAERKNLARELHDDTLQTLIALGQNTQYARLWNQDEKVSKALDQSSSLVDQGMKSLRRLVRGLRPIYIEDLGLAAALAALVSEHNQSGGAKFHFHSEGMEQRLGPDVEMALFRVAQEALNNAARHARARNIWTSLHFQPEGLTLEIRDDGRGFRIPADPGSFARAGHYGWLGMHERCELIGAKLTLRSSEEEGSLVRVRYPVQAEMSVEAKNG